MRTVMRVSSGVRALVALLLLSVSAENTDQCDNEDDNCHKWTKTSQNQPLTTEGVVTYEQLKDMISAGSVQLLDVRQPEELEAGFIPGATNIPLLEVEQALRLSPDQFRERYGVTKPHRNDSDLVLYCMRGIRSLTALNTARALGYTRARHYAGGFQEWLQREEGVVTYEQLKDMISAGSVQLLDVRQPEELEAGFIPGATNIPLLEVEQALRLSQDQFRERYGVTKPHRNDSDLVLYCRRGIRSLTALNTARALGYTRARHYAGGFQEWLQREGQ